VGDTVATSVGLARATKVGVGVGKEVEVDVGTGVGVSGVTTATTDSVTMSTGVKVGAGVRVLNNWLLATSLKSQVNNSVKPKKRTRASTTINPPSTIFLIYLLSPCFPRVDLLLVRI
jgi:hypothetical protein